MHWARLCHATYGTRDSRCHDRDMPRRARSARPPRLYALLLFFLPRLLRLRLRFFLGGDPASASTTAVLFRFFFVVLVVLSFLLLCFFLLCLLCLTFFVMVS